MKDSRYIIIGNFLTATRYKGLASTFLNAASLQPKAEPVMQYLLGMNGLFECGVAIPLVEQNRIGLGKKGFELTLPFVFR